MDFSPTALLDPDRRAQVADDPSIGVGNLLESALRVSPDPHAPFIYTARPLVNTDGRLQASFSLSQLDELAQSWSVWYLDQGVRPRDRVVVYLDDSFAYSLHLYALSQIGAIPVLVNSHAQAATAAALCRQTRPVGIYTTHERLRTLDGTGALDSVRWAATTQDRPAPPPRSLPAEARYQHVDDDPVAIMHSSGTTGVPKAVIHTHRSLMAGPKFRLVDHKEVPGALMMTALPQSHLGCIAFSVYAVLGGTPLLPFYDPSGEELARAVAKYKPTAV
ncbi:MAG TPA: class I adenylate-forming enzyme family protein, partial [Acidimicrobiales bacterium]|nr:class I adenylate-forming enzyme family protein [Acidimicrobiales bacterium]